MKTAWEAGRAWRAALRIGFVHVFAFRADILIQLVSICVVASLNGSLWYVATQGRSDVGGIPSGELRAYALVAWVAVSFVGCRVNEEIGRRARDGQIAADLLRPMSLQDFWYARDLGRALATLLVQSTPLFLGMLYLTGLPFPAHASTWAYTLLSLVLGHATNFGLCFLVGLASLGLRNASGLTHLKSTLVSIFSGALIPIELYGPELRPWVYALPFRALAHTPASIFLEREGAASGLAFQATWAAGLWLLGMASWHAVSRTIHVQGG